jgi:hypothetical protein
MSRQTKIERLARRDREAKERAALARRQLVAELTAARSEDTTMRELAEWAGLSFQRIHVLTGGAAEKSEVA